MQTQIKHLLAALVLLSILSLQLSTARAQGTAFSYQGQLVANGAAASGSYDLRFAVFDSSAAVNQIGGALTNLATPVTAGLFTVTLDFGTGVFTGPARWLEVGVRSNGTGIFTPLSPLQLFTASPYAVAAGNLLGTLPASQLTGTANLTGSFTGNGSGLTNTPGTLIWQVPSGTSVQTQSSTGYILTNTQLVTLTLPPSPNVGQVVQVAGVGSGGWILAQNPGQWVSGSFTAWVASTAPNTYWVSIASSSDGTKLAAVADDYPEAGIYTSINGGANWTLQTNPPNTFLASITSSSDGSKLVAVASGGGIYTSVNSGTNWTLQPNAPLTNWTSIVCSSDGTKLAAVEENVGTNRLGGIYTSIDSGTNWTLQLSGPVAFSYSIACSSDGTKLVTGADYIYTSLNGGTNWTQQTNAPAYGWLAVTSSSDGSKLAALDSNGDIYTSISFGTNWDFQTNYGNGNNYYNPIGCVSSSDGTKLAALFQTFNGDLVGGSIYTSINSGTNWTQQSSAPNEAWGGIASSSDGTKLAAAVGDPVYGIQGGIYTSTDPNPGGTTIGTAGFLQGTAGSSIQLIYVGGGNFVAFSQSGTIYEH